MVVSVQCDYHKYLVVHVQCDYHKNLVVCLIVIVLSKWLSVFSVLVIAHVQCDYHEHLVVHLQKEFVGQIVELSGIWLSSGKATKIIHRKIKFTYMDNEVNKQQQIKN